MLPGCYERRQPAPLLLSEHAFVGELLDFAGGVEHVAAKGMGAGLLRFQRGRLVPERLVRRGRLNRRIPHPQPRHHHQDDQDPDDVGHDVQEGVVAGVGRVLLWRASHGQ